MQEDGLSVGGSLGELTDKRRTVCKLSGMIATRRKGALVLRIGCSVRVGYFTFSEFQSDRDSQVITFRNFLSWARPASDVM